MGGGKQLDRLEAGRLYWGDAKLVRGTEGGKFARQKVVKRNSSDVIMKGDQFLRFACKTSLQCSMERESIPLEAKQGDAARNSCNSCLPAWMEKFSSFFAQREKKMLHMRVIFQLTYPGKESRHTSTSLIRPKTESELFDELFSVIGKFEHYYHKSKVDAELVYTWVT